MVQVRANTKGYVGGIIREMGEVFEWPEGHELGLWVEVIGGKKAETVSPAGDVKPADDGKDQGGKGKGRGKKAETVAAATAAPFADAPAPEVLKGNGIQEALGATVPDWMPPSADDSKPVQADD